MYTLPSFSIPRARVSSTFDPIAAMRMKHLEPIRKRIQNESPYYSQIHFSKNALGGHYSPRVQKILNALRKGKMEGYKLFSGEASHHEFNESNGYRESVSKHEIFRLKNDHKSVVLEFRLSPDEESYRYIHILFFSRDPDQQGSFHENKRLLVKELGHFFLELLGYDFIYGRATWCSNSEIRRPCPKNEDWRHKRVYVGLNKNLEAILISGIQLMYYRMGFLPMSVFLESTSDEMVFLPSRKMEAKLRDAITDDQWDEITKYHGSNNKRWRKLVREREEQVGEDELQKRKNRALEMISNKDCW